MIDSLINLLKYYEEKGTIKVLISILDILVVSSISSYIFKSAFFSFEIIDLLDYKRVIEFVLNGEFLLPFIIFVGVWLVTLLPIQFLHTSIVNRSKSGQSFLNRILSLFFGKTKWSEFKGFFYERYKSLLVPQIKDLGQEGVSSFIKMSDLLVKEINQLRRPLSKYLVTTGRAIVALVFVSWELDYVGIWTFVISFVFLLLVGAFVGVLVAMSQDSITGLESFAEDLKK